MYEDYQISQKRRKIENFAIAILLILSVCAVGGAVFHFVVMDEFVFGALEMHHTTKIILAVMMLLITKGVYSRRRLYWGMSIGILAVGIGLNCFLLFSPFHLIMMIGEVISLVILLIYHADFCRKSVRGKVRELSDEQRKKVRAIVCKYGQNPGSYLTLEDDKTIYFGKDVEGVVPYGIVGDVVVVNGDPICAPENFEALLKEFSAFCSDNIYSCIFLSTTDMFMETYKKSGFAVVKCGEEPRFDVREFSLAGGKIANVRAEINHARKDEVSVHEYKIAEKRDLSIEADMSRITNEWLTEKQSSELSFTLGKMDFDHFMDKRYFYACDKEDNMVGFIIFVPFAGMTGYMADITRRAKNAPRGVMEIIVYDAFEQFKAEGLQWVSMGLAPLARMDQGENKDELTSKLLGYVYEHLNGFYGFKDLYKAKEKYNPTIWVPGYFVFKPKIVTPDLAYAVVAIQNPHGFWDYITGYLSRNKLFSRKKQDGGN